MPSRFYIRVPRKDGSSRYSSLFDTLEEADRWRQTVRQDPLVQAAVIAQIESEQRNDAPVRRDVPD